MKKAVILAGLMVFLLAGSLFAQELTYRVHAAEIGWMDYVPMGRIGGSTGQGRRIESIQLRLNGGPGGSIEYQVHQSTIGWGNSWTRNNQEAGVTGRSLQLEAIRVRLTGPISNSFDVMYRVHMAGIGWGPWVTNGADAGTTGQNRQIESIQVLLVQK